MEKKTACKDDLEHYRMEYIAQTILEEKGQLVHLEAEVLKSIRENEIIAAHYYDESEPQGNEGPAVLRERL